MGISRMTVRKYLAVSEPIRREQKPRPRPVFDEVRERIDAILEEWSGRTTTKQRVTGTRLHQVLRSEGFDVGLTLVRGYLLKKRLAKAEVFIPLVHSPGDEAQVDFFEVVVDVGTERRAVWMFLLRLMHSGRDFARIYEHCDQVSFLDGHVRAFTHFGAVPRRCVYDNLSAAVKRILPKRELTQRFAALASHYLFEPCFARVGVGHDKGGVESRGRGVRLQSLTPIPKNTSLDLINHALLADLDQRADMDRFKLDRGEMLECNAVAFEPAIVGMATVRSTATVAIAGAVYSVPSHWARSEITTFVGVSAVKMMRGSESIERPRQGRGGKLIRYRDYLPELSRKPQALRQVANELLKELGEPYATLWTMLVEAHGSLDAARVLAKILGTLRHGDEARLTPVLTSLLVAPTFVSEAALPPPTQVAVPATLAHHHVESSHARYYDVLLMEAANG